MECEWYTPKYIIDLAREVLGTIDVDPASNTIAQETVQANIFYTKEDSGLIKPWVGNVWCNPPYSAALLPKFTSKFMGEYLLGNMTSGIILTNSGTDTIWNQSLITGVQAYTLGRISFIQPDGTEKGKGGRGQCFTYVGNNPEKFVDTFSSICWFPNL